MQPDEPTGGAYIKAARLRAGMGLRELARESGLSPSYISLIERGLRDAPPNTIALIAQAIGRYAASKS